MLAVEFLKAIEAHYPSMRPLDGDQIAAFTNGIRALEGSALERLVDPVTRAYRRFPNKGEVWAVARSEGVLPEDMRRKENRPHVWTQTDCKHCAGEGYVALFGQMFPSAGHDGMDEFIVEFAHPHSSVETVSRRETHGSDLTEVFARCYCPASDAPTVETGPIKWSGKFRVFRNPPHYD